MAAGAELLQLGAGMTLVLKKRGGVLQYTAQRLLQLSVLGPSDGGSSVTEAKRALLEVLCP